MSKRRIDVYWTPPELLNNAELLVMDEYMYKVATSLAMSNKNNRNRIWWEDVGSFVLFHRLVQNEKFRRQLDTNKLPLMRGVPKRKYSCCGVYISMDMVNESCNDLLANATVNKEYYRYSTICRFKTEYLLGHVPWGRLSEDGVFAYKMWAMQNKGWLYEEY